MKHAVSETGSLFIILKDVSHLLFFVIHDNRSLCFSTGEREKSMTPWDNIASLHDILPLVEPPLKKGVKRH